MKITSVVAYAKDGVIGNGLDIPWKSGPDLKHFKKVTMGGAVIMGRKTYESIGFPLPGRRNIVLTRDRNWTRNGVFSTNNIERAIRTAGSKSIFVIGGSEVYALFNPLITNQIVTEIHGDYEGDVRYPSPGTDGWFETSRESHPEFDVPLDWVTLERI